eukprot:NODE_2465_length_1574_cov_45.625086_g2122_i0.p1 GENE.NODE_2465_length_1574_cov_45.625086_g2122_i0~~NODE_2465_length_1574_cov_45.625086_g2122_i0.p1  ORF type:complete len:459 (-),score=63.44 NODE_2465_length_1574_cov_45.625086_g2122_i0:111-1487(-)
MGAWPSTQIDSENEGDEIGYNAIHYDTLRIPSHMLNLSKIEVEPLLASPYQPPGSAIGVMLNIAKNAVGGGILALPYAFRLAGLAGGIIYLIVVGIAALASIYLIAKGVDIIVGITQDPLSFTYRRLIERSFGSKYGWAIAAVIICYTVGTQITYLLALRELLMPPLEHWFGENSIFNNNIFVVSCCLVVLLSLVSLQDLEPLKYTSMAGLSFIFFLAISLIYWFGSHKVADGITAVKFGVPLLQVTPMVAFTWGIHYNIPTYYKELKNRTPVKITMIAGGAYGLCLILYLIVGICGYLCYGNDTKPNILNSVENNTMFNLVQLGVGLEILCTHPIIHNATRVALRRILIPDQIAPSILVPLRVWIVSFCIIIVTAIISLVLKDIGKVISYNSAVFGCIVYFILPPMAFLRLTKRRSQILKPQRVLAYFIFCLGWVVLITGVIGTSFKLKIIGTVGFM